MFLMVVGGGVKCLPTLAWRSPVFGMLQDGGRTRMCLGRGKCKVCWMEKAPQDFDEFTRKNLTEDVTDFKIDSDHNCV